MESVSSNYPGYFQADTDSDKSSAYDATLTAHAAASVERNQDAQFSAGRDLGIVREVVGGSKDARIESLVNRFELSSQLKDFEIRSLERSAEVNEKLTRIEAQATAREIAGLRAAAQDSTNARILTLLEKLASK